MGGGGAKTSDFGPKPRKMHLLLHFYPTTGFLENEASLSDISQVERFDQFLCHGEGVFGDCVEWVSPGTEWPAGDVDDEVEEDEDDDGEPAEEDEETQPVFLQGFEEELIKEAEAAVIRPAPAANVW